MKEEKLCPCGGIVANRFWGLCPFCNLRRLRKGKPKKKYPKKKFRKATGERKIHLELWDEQMEQTGEHRCQNCCKPLGNEPLPIYFSHIKPKSTHPHLRLVKSNYMIDCEICHHVWSWETRENYNKRKNLYGEKE